MLFEKLLTLEQKKRIDNKKLIEMMRKKYEYFGFDPDSFKLWY